MILIIDNGSQYTHLIKRTCRDLEYDAEIVNSRESFEKIEKLVHAKQFEKIILSGGPGSVYSDPPNLSSIICTKIKNNELEIPLLGICYGHQMISHIFGAKVAKGKSAEYGFCEITIDEGKKENANGILTGIPKRFRAWVSHFDEAKELPKDFVKLAHSESCEIEAMKHKTKQIFGLQFHPEVWHTENGEEILKNFLKIK
ncbi:GMP synthase subunit A [Candidatus Micrarchaeota archaeon]|nr:GMP synthase subunit A [Candidatus Micrarchaeota archaeon]